VLDPLALPSVALCFGLCGLYVGLLVARDLLLSAKVTRVDLAFRIVCHTHVLDRYGQGVFGKIVICANREAAGHIVFLRISALGANCFLLSRVRSVGVYSLFFDLKRDLEVILVDSECLVRAFHSAFGHNGCRVHDTFNYKKQV